MSTLTQLTDRELDAVMGGSINIAAFQNAIAANSVVTGQAQFNLAVVAVAGQGGSQTSNNNQGALATNS